MRRSIRWSKFWICRKIEIRRTAILLENYSLYYSHQALVMFLSRLLFRMTPWGIGRSDALPMSFCARTTCMDLVSLPFCATWFGNCRCYLLVMLCACGDGSNHGVSPPSTGDDACLFSWQCAALSSSSPCLITPCRQRLDRFRGHHPPSRRGLKLIAERLVVSTDNVVCRWWW